MNVEEILVFTDGSITTKGVGAGVYTESLNHQESYRLKDGCYILQSVVLTIMKAAKRPELRDVTNRDVTV